ncbi:hypothetical protein ACFL0W_04840, partial [Nanoarchaeota archaeon]
MSGLAKVLTLPLEQRVSDSASSAAAQTQFDLDTLYSSLQEFSNQIMAYGTLDSELISATSEWQSLKIENKRSGIWSPEESKLFRQVENLQKRTKEAYGSLEKSADSLVDSYKNSDQKDPTLNSIIDFIKVAKSRGRFYSRSSIDVDGHTDLRLNEFAQIKLRIDDYLSSSFLSERNTSRENSTVSEIDSLRKYWKFADIDGVIQDYKAKDERGYSILVDELLADFNDGKDPDAYMTKHDLRSIIAKE